MFAFAALFVSCSAAQDVKVPAAQGMGDTYWTKLAFSKDGRILREVGSLDARTTRQGWRARADTYDVATGAIIHQRDLQPFTVAYSTTSDGRTVVIAADNDRPDARSHLFLLDTDTGATQDVPANWFDPDEDRPFAAISGDGLLVSAYSEFGPQQSGMLVSVYDWRTKRLVARQTRDEFAGGISDGSVTEDGKIAFSNNRSGSYIVDPKTGQLLVHVGNDAFRSSNGAWVVEFPDQRFADAPKDVTIKDGENGRVLGKLDLQITDDQAKQRWLGAFCGTSGKFVAASGDIVGVFRIPSGKKIASFPVGSWRDTSAQDYPTLAVACSSNGKRVAIRSGVRLTLHNLK
jgi:outer membrane protein assembly factor BamB